MQVQMALAASTVMAMFVALILIPTVARLLFGKLMLLSQLDYLHYILGVALTLALISLPHCHQSERGVLVDVDGKDRSVDTSTDRPRAIPKSAKARRDALVGERQARERMNQALTVLEDSTGWELLKQEGDEFEVYWSRGRVKFGRKLPLEATLLVSTLERDDFTWAERLIQTQPTMAATASSHLLLTLRGQFALPTLQVRLRRRRYDLIDGRTIFFYTSQDVIDWALLVVRPLGGGQTLLQGALAGSFKSPVPSLIKASLLVEHLPRTLSKLAVHHTFTVDPRTRGNNPCLMAIRRRLDVLEERLSTADFAPPPEASTGEDEGGSLFSSVITSVASLFSHSLLLLSRRQSQRRPSSSMTTM